jgi:hypothetical protein
MNSNCIKLGVFRVGPYPLSGIKLMEYFTIFELPLCVKSGAKPFNV